MNVNLTIAQDSRYVGDDTWKWAIWLEGPDAELDLVAHVVYTLHRTFPKPVRVVADRRSKFRLEDLGWETFTIYVEAVLKDGDHIKLEHDLKLFRLEEQVPRKRAGSRGATAMSSLHDKLRRSGPKKLLAIDGGGIRAVIALEVLLEIEKILGGGRFDFRLASYFDYISGTSTGAITATGLSLGMSVQQLLDFYQQKGPQMFDHASLLRRFRYKFDDRSLASMLQEMMGAETTLGSDALQTLLMIVLRNATTDSIWPVSNNPYAKYNDEVRPDCNLDLPLWQLVRASTASPTYFPPEVIRIGSKDFVFVDGGLTMYNNPAFLTFLMATTKAYWPNKDKFGPGKVDWPAATGIDKLLLVSVGTGSAANANEGLLPGEMNLVYNATTIPAALMFAAQNEQDMLCRIFGDCLVGDELDREIGDLIGEGSRGAVSEKLFTYLRYGVDIGRRGLAALDLGHIDPVMVQRMDSADGLNEMREVGRAIAERKVRAEHFARFPFAE